MRKKLEITKERIMLVAQKLFAELSFYRTTMKDIADAAKICRRTLYTHFKSKEEIYNQIVDQKLEMIDQKLKQARVTALPADKRLKLYIKERFKLVEELMCSSRYIKEIFLHNNSKIEILRKTIDEKELELLTEILREGTKNGIFSIKNPSMFAHHLQPLLKSLEFGFIRQSETLPSNQVVNEYVHILFHGILKKQI